MLGARRREHLAVFTIASGQGRSRAQGRAFPVTRSRGSAGIGIRVRDDSGFPSFAQTDGPLPAPPRGPTLVPALLVRLAIDGPLGGWVGSPSRPNSLP